MRVVVVLTILILSLSVSGAVVAFPDELDDYNALAEEKENLLLASTRRLPSTLPDASTISCSILPDGLDLCTYTNVCVDPPQPDGTPSRLYFVAPSAGSSGWMHSQEASLFQARGKRRRILTPIKEMIKLLNARVMRLSSPRGPVLPEEFDLTYKDLSQLPVALAPRLVPKLFDEARLTASLIRSSRTVPQRFGGDFEGSVAWVDSLYLLSAFWMHKGHLWGTPVSTFHPLLSAFVANKTLRLGLPPLDNVMVWGTRTTAQDHASPWQGKTKRFVRGYFQHLMRYLADGREAVQGHDAAAAAPKAAPGGSGGSGTGGADAERQAGRAPGFSDARPLDRRRIWFPALEEWLRRVGVDAAALEGAGSRPATGPATTPPLPALDSMDALRLDKPFAGTRMIYTGADVPRQPLAQPVKGGGSEAVRVCAKRMVALGHKPGFIGGALEDVVFRHFAATALGLPHLMASARELAASMPLRVLVLDRKVGDRGMLNGADIPRLMRKHGVEHTLLTDSQLVAMKFTEQATVWASHRIAIVVHGAALYNLVFMPRGSVVIEIFPWGVWKPGYARAAASVGITHIPVFCHHKGPGVPYNVHFEGKPPGETSRACDKTGYAAVTRNNCFHAYREASVIAPMLRLESALLTALNTLGELRRWPGSAIAEALDGAPLTFSRGVGAASGHQGGGMHVRNYSAEVAAAAVAGCSLLCADEGAAAAGMAAKSASRAAAAARAAG